MIVLGGGSSQSPQQNTLGLFNYPRLVEAVRIYQYALKQGIQYTIFLSGGGSATKAEAVVGRLILTEMGIPTKQIISENRSMNTWQNAQYTQPLLKQHHIQEALLVTSGLHMHRALLYFRHFNIKVIPATADFPHAKLGWWPLAYNLAFTQLAMHEWYGIAQFHIYNFFGLNKQHVKNR